MAPCALREANMPERHLANEQKRKSQKLFHHDVEKLLQHPFYVAPVYDGRPTTQGLEVAPRHTEKTPARPVLSETFVPPCSQN